MATKETSGSMDKHLRTPKANTNANNEASIIQRYCKGVPQQTHLEVGKDPTEQCIDYGSESCGILFERPPASNHYKHNTDTEFPHSQ